MKKVTAFILALTVAAGLIFSFAPGASAAYLDLQQIYTEYGLGQTVTVQGSTDLSLIMLYLSAPDGRNLITNTMNAYDLVLGYSFRIGEDWELGPYTLLVGSGTEVVNEYHFDVVQEPVKHVTPGGSGNGKVVATSISVSPANITIKAGESATVTVTSDDKSVRWETDDTDKVSVSGTTTATITGKRTGTATVWAYSGNNYATVTVTVLPADRDTEPDRGGRQENNVVPQEPEKTTEPEKTQPETLSDAFTDLDGVAWAKEAVNALAAAGIVNGVGDGTFAPSRGVTRAEFVKMTVAAFGFKSKGNAPEFTDVDGSEWYADVVGVAAENGIVNGYSDGSFGPSKNISCQDAALILSRVANMKGISLPMPRNGMETGASEYAGEAVELLWSNGVIAEEIDFKPFENATRAQSAYMIYKIFELGQSNG